MRHLPCTLALSTLIALAACVKSSGFIDPAEDPDAPGNWITIDGKTTEFEMISAETLPDQSDYAYLRRLYLFGAFDDTDDDLDISVGVYLHDLTPGVHEIAPFGTPHVFVLIGEDTWAPISGQIEIQRAGMAPGDLVYLVARDLVLVDGCRTRELRASMAFSVAVTPTLDLSFGYLGSTGHMTADMRGEEIDDFKYLGTTRTGLSTVANGNPAWFSDSGDLCEDPSLTKWAIRFLIDIVEIEAGTYHLGTLPMPFIYIYRIVDGTSLVDSHVAMEGTVTFEGDFSEELGAVVRGSATGLRFYPYEPGQGVDENGPTITLDSADFRLLLEPGP